jgi:hypothetical protein
MAGQLLAAADSKGNRTMINPQPQTFEEFQEAWTQVADLLQAIRECPDLIVGDRSIRIRPTTGGVGQDSVPTPVEEENPPCGFGGFIQEDGATYLVGGAVSAGPDNHAVDNFEITTGTNGVTYLWLQVNIKANVTDGVLLPGLEESLSASVIRGASYPSQTIPTAAAPSQDAIIPLGMVTVADGAATFRQDGPCSPVQINHCPGSVSYA